MSEEHPELGESPTRVGGALELAEPYPFADPSQVFDCDSASGAFGLGHYPLRNWWLTSAAKRASLPGHVSAADVSADFGVLPLELLAHLPVCGYVCPSHFLAPRPHRVRRRRKSPATPGQRLIAGDRDVLHTQIHTRSTVARMQMSPGRGQGLGHRRHWRSKTRSACHGSGAAPGRFSLCGTSAKARSGRVCR